MLARTTRPPVRCSRSGWESRIHSVLRSGSGQTASYGCRFIMTAHAGWLLRHVGSADTYALYNASMGTDTRVAQTSTTTKDGTPQASAGVLLPLHEEHCWPRAACQTPPARAVRLGVCRCRCKCDPAQPCRPLALDPTAGNPVADRCCGKFFFSSNSHRNLITLSCVKVFSRHLFLRFLI